MNEITKEVVKAALEDDTIVGDGHSIYYESKYGPHFDVTDLVVEHKSDMTSHKGTIFDNTTGEPMESLKGVYNLTFLHWLCDEIGLTWRDYGSYGGRGFQAQAMVRTIEKWASTDYEPITQEEYEAQKEKEAASE